MGALSLPRLHQFSYNGASNWHKPLQMEIPAVDPALPHKMQLKHFVKVVRREVEPVVTPADNVKTLTLLNASRRPPRPASSSSCSTLGQAAAETPCRAPRSATNKPLFFAPRAASCPRGILLRCQ